MPSPGPVDESEVQPCQGRKTEHWFLAKAERHVSHLVTRVERGIFDLRCVVQILVRQHSGGRIVQIHLSPLRASFKDVLVAVSEASVLPSLETPSVYVTAQIERAWSRWPDAKPVKVRYGCVRRDRRGFVRGVPEIQQVPLGVDQAGVRSGGDLSRGVVDFIKDNIPRRTP